MAYWSRADLSGSTAVQLTTALPIGTSSSTLATNRLDAINFGGLSLTSMTVMLTVALPVNDGDPRSTAVTVKMYGWQELLQSKTIILVDRYQSTRWVYREYVSSVLDLIVYLVVWWCSVQIGGPHNNNTGSWNWNDKYTLMIIITNKIPKGWNQR